MSDTPDIAELRAAFEARPNIDARRHSNGEYLFHDDEKEWQAALWAHRRATQWRRAELTCGSSGFSHYCPNCGRNPGEGVLAALPEVTP